jgi:hypothetical protein
MRRSQPLPLGSKIESRPRERTNVTHSAIISKLKLQLAKRIRTEADALYLIVEVRKLLEQQQAKKQYEYLTFHCDWALHAKLDGTTAQDILRLFDAANIHLKAGVELHELPGLLSMEIDRISKLRYFEQQLNKFLKVNGIPTLHATRVDGWGHFIHLYAKIVEDCPLVMTAKNSSATIASVTLKLELGKTPKHGEMWFGVRWIIESKNGQTGEIYVVNSFSVNPHRRLHRAAQRK